MKRLALAAFHALGLLSLVALLTPNTWRWVARDSDPRTRLFSHTIILHRDDQVVVRRPSGGLSEFNYDPVYGAATLVFIVWVIALAVRFGPRGANVDAGGAFEVCPPAETNPGARDEKLPRSQPTAENP